MERIPSRERLADGRHRTTGNGSHRHTLVRCHVENHGKGSGRLVQEVPSERGPHGRVQTILGRVLQLVPRNGQAGLRTTYRQQDVRANLVVLRHAAEAPASVHALHHRRTLATHLRPPTGREHHVSPLRTGEPTKEDADSIALDGVYIVHIENVKSIVAGVRTVRNQKNIAPKEALTLEVVGGNPEADFECVIKKMANLSAINTVAQKGEGTASFMVGTTEYAVPLGNLIDVEAEIAKQEAELKHLEGFLTGVLKKLSNERFVANAPAAVVDMERKKQADAESKIAALKESLAKLKK